MKSIVGFFLVSLIVPQAVPRPSSAAEEDLIAAEREYREQLAERPADPTLNYNLGTVLLIRESFEESRPFLEEAASAPDSVIRRHAAYNLGNSDLRPAFDDPDLADRDARLRRAIDEYRVALTVDPGDEDARWNLELARRLLERDDPPPADGGGGGGGGSGQGPPNPGENRPAPSPSDGRGPEPEATRTEAEELLDAAMERELQVQRESLRKPQNEPIRP